MRRTFQRTVITLGLAAILPLSGCTRIKGLAHHLLHLLHHGGTPVAAAATPAPVLKSTPAPAPAAPTPTPAPAINKTASVIVLLYHRFETTLPKNPAARELVITPTEFDKQMQEIKDDGFTVIPMQDFIAWRKGDKAIPAKSCIITIDDGYLSGYDTAWPILKKYGYPFTMFVYIDYINSGGKSLSWDQLAEMRDAGVDIESHTYSHSHLTSPGFGVDATTRARVEKDIQTLGREGWLQKEVVGSKRVLEQQLGIKVDAFAYPYGSGSNDPHIRAVVKEAGYDAAFNVYGRRNGYSFPPYDQIGRYAIGGDNAPKLFADAMKMIGGGEGGVPTSEPAFAELAAASMVTEPAEGSTTPDTTPTVKANLATMGAIDPGSVKMRISGYGVVPAKYDPKTKIVSYKIPTPMAKDTYFVFIDATIGGKQAETKWNFNVDPNAKPGSIDTSLPAGTP
ncbi:MAG TPA: polysaccharide deacetylase family protein [Chthoniobacteraceae bacterium]|jgi:peptidoglycan/xylan/chitin deacetylase (PgdA/CDA1 family)|nr:polysaccharide deacetylase family protein [Chthoniobacteraceae bacterium]